MTTIIQSHVSEENSKVDFSVSKRKWCIEPVSSIYGVLSCKILGSETTGVAVFDYEPLKAKTGNTSLKPLLKWYYDQILPLDILVYHIEFHERIKTPFTVCKYLH